MTITTLDSTTALIVIDLQAGTLGGPTAHPAGEIVARAAELLAAFRAQGRLVVLANVDGTPAGRTQYGEGAREFPAAFSALVPELGQQPGDVTLTRATWSAFAGTDLDAILTERGITQIVLAGIATSFGVESTARDAYDRGYSVALAIDAITDRSADAHDASVARVFPALGQTGSAAEVIALLG
ncbi:cysteine hydrolase [Cryobacterium sp. SO2]|uniref:cysteine hydrolase family protein n=1 Tax=Cryobacterium sp. SO2 TaxID=1897060 RepID=UPI00223DD978|nr:isochorismatase family cysteine hydrolase [Cryobacterium sp. SO2]WEO77156.1 cysteine hydrolase [Cryobacterium sp. SO2]